MSFLLKMKFWTNLKYTTRILFCLFSDANASENLNEELYYSAKDHTVQYYASKDDFDRKFNEILNDETRIGKYRLYEETFKKEYLDEQVRQWDAKFTKINLPGPVFLGGVLGFGAGLASYPTIFFLTVQKVAGSTIGIVALTCSPMIGGLLVGALGGYIFAACGKRYVENKKSQLILVECPIDTLQEGIREEVKKELFDLKYLTGLKEFPTKTSKNLVDAFIGKICESDTLS